MRRLGKNRLARKPARRYMMRRVGVWEELVPDSPIEARESCGVRIEVAEADEPFAA